MHDDALKQLWQGQQFEARPTLPDEAQIAALKKRMSGFDTTIQWRDYREVAACLVTIVFFGWNLLVGKYPALMQAGFAVLLASAVLIAWKLIGSKRRLPKAEPNAPVFEAVKVELQKVENQIGLLESVAWWYLLPLFVGMMLCTWGARGSFPSKLFGSAFTFVIYVFLYWLNQFAVKRGLRPLQRALAALLHSAETGEPLDQTHVALLRPIINASMTAAVQPAEFKVAFWGIALFGEIGFVGIWFFGMLDRTDFNVPRMFLPQHLVWIVPFLLAGLLFSWLLQKTTAKAVGVSPLGVHLGKGQILILWDEIKEVRPLRILHIRSLWLISESGEKTMMPWTSLERHSDLKSAVESSAPANHPLRKYLSLLQPEPPRKTS